jgi:hypothetical protein
METTLTRLVIIEATAWTVVIIKSATRTVVVMETAFARLVVIETTAWTLVIVESAARAVVTTAFATFFVVEATAGAVTKLTVAEPAVATVVIKTALTSRLVAKTSLFVSFLVTVTVIEFEGLSLLELFRFPNSGARTLARSFVVSHFVGI